MILIFGGLHGSVALVLALNIYLDEYFIENYPQIIDKVFIFSIKYYTINLTDFIFHCWNHMSQLIQ